MDEQSDSRTLRALMYEHMLMSRHALQGSAPRLRSATLERSAAVLLARLEASGPLRITTGGGAEQAAAEPTAIGPAAHH